MRYNTKEAATAIVKLQPFTTNGSLSGMIISGNLAVFSYAEPIACFDPEKKRVHLNERKYSVTTGRHQTQTREAAEQLKAQGWDVDVWDAKQFEDVTGLNTLNRNPYYSFY